jgi:transcriptional regulator with PAS, ATPase and Fis domain
MTQTSERPGRDLETLLVQLDDRAGALVTDQDRLLPAETVLFSVGQSAESLYLVLAGEIDLRESLTEGGQTLQTIHPGELLGCSWLVPPHRWRFDAIARTDVRLAVLDGIQLRRRCQSDHDVGFRMMSAISDLMAQRLEAARHREAEEEDVVQEGVAAMLGDSKPMRALRKLLVKLSVSPAPALIIGESGTGKELVARALHQSGPRRHKRFVAENCAALPESLLESELFGYVRGAFSGAHRDKQGLFEAADGGTLFLDEIADTPETVQAKLLRALESGEIRRLGETETRPVDVRVVAATSCDLDAYLRNGRFRPELYYRLRVLSVEVPPLRDRSEDVPQLAEHFLEVFAARAGKRLPGFDECALAALGSYPWPGNVRELRNEIERAATLVDDGEHIAATALSESLQSCREDFPCHRRQGESLTAALDRLKRQMIEEAVSDCDGNVSHAAHLLGMSRQNLQNTMRRLDLR